MEIEKYPITGVALGPGDPELITLKGLKTLEEADVIYYAASKVEASNITSFSKQILDAYNLKALCKPLLFPMSGKGRSRFYNEAYDVLKSDYELGLRVVMVTEGDLGYYSTFGYIVKLAKGEGIPVSSVPGVPAFIAAGASANAPIVDGSSTFINIARPESFEQIELALKSDNAVVVMKIKVLQGWANFLKNTEREFIYIEKTGTSEEYITTNYNDLENREIPYFALIIFPKVE